MVGAEVGKVGWAWQIMEPRTLGRAWRAPCLATLLSVALCAEILWAPDLVGGGQEKKLPLRGA